MILLFPWSLTYASDHLVQLAARACAAATVPLTLHLDHAQDAAQIRHAADISPGFDSIMIDMSHHAKEENLVRTKELVEYCHARGIATEAEPGRIEGGEDGLADTAEAELEGMLTTAEEAGEFVETGIDWLAPAFGNVHGAYGPRGIRLDYERLRGIREAVGGRVRLVLHGTDGFDEEIFRRCIEVGVVKVNVNKVVNRAYAEVCAEMSGKVGVTKVMEEGTERMRVVVEKLMDQLRSSGKA